MELPHCFSHLFEHQNTRYFLQLLTCCVYLHSLLIQSCMMDVSGIQLFCLNSEHSPASVMLLVVGISASVALIKPGTNSEEEEPAKQTLYFDVIMTLQQRLFVRYVTERLYQKAISTKRLTHSQNLIRGHIASRLDISL